MALIYIIYNNTKYKVKCSSLVQTIVDTFADETDKAYWNYAEFCGLVRSLPKKAIIRFLQQSTSDEISPSGIVQFEEESVDSQAPIINKTIPTPFLFNDKGTIKNCSSLNTAALKIAFKEFHQITYNFANIEHARKLLEKLEKDRSIKRLKENSLQRQEMENKKSILQPLKLELPQFDGSSDAEDYIHKLETISKVGEWSDTQKISALIMGLIGNAGLWYRNNETILCLKNWPELKQEFLNNFRKIKSIGDDWVIFTNRRQTYNKKPQEYLENKVFLARNLKPKIPEGELIDWIIGGMLPHLAQQIYLLNNDNIEDLKNNLSKVIKSFEISGNPSETSKNHSNSMIKSEENSRLEKIEQMMQQLIIDKDLRRNSFRGRSPEKSLRYGARNGSRNQSPYRSKPPGQPQRWSRPPERYGYYGNGSYRGHSRGQFSFNFNQRHRGNARKFRFRSPSRNYRDYSRSPPRYHRYGGSSNNKGEEYEPKKYYGKNNKRGN